MKNEKWRIKIKEEFDKYCLKKFKVMAAQRKAKFDPFVGQYLFYKMVVFKILKV